MRALTLSWRGAEDGKGPVIPLECSNTLTSNGGASDLVQPIAIPSVGGLSVSLCVTIFIAPTLFCALEEWKRKRSQSAASVVALINRLAAPVPS